MRTNFWLPLLAALLASTACYAAAPPVLGDPLKGVIVGEDVVTCVLVKGHVYVYVHSLGKDRPSQGRICAICDGSPVRWQIGHGAFWVSQDWNFGVPGRHSDLGGGVLERIDMAVFSNAGEDIFHRLGAGFSGNTPPRSVSE